MKIKDWNRETTKIPRQKFHQSLSEFVSLVDGALNWPYRGTLNARKIHGGSIQPKDEYHVVDFEIRTSGPISKYFWLEPFAEPVKKGTFFLDDYARLSGNLNDVVAATGMADFIYDNLDVNLSKPIPERGVFGRTYDNAVSYLSNLVEKHLTPSNVLT